MSLGWNNGHRLQMSAVCALVVTVAARADTPSTAEIRGVQPREVVLDNGLTLLLMERHEQPTVAAGVFYDVGAVNDPLGKSGIAHLFEHMLFKGSRVIGTTDFEAEMRLIEEHDRLRAKLEAEMNRMRELKRRGVMNDVLDPKQWTPEYTALKKQDDELTQSLRGYVKNNEFANLYTSNGGTFNASTMSDATFYFVQLPANKVELFFWLESDRMANSAIREFYVERDNVREERRLRVESTPTGSQDEAFNALFWQSHPYGIPVIGWPSEVESIARHDAIDFYKVHYAPNNARVVLVGDFDPEQVITLAKQYFGRIPRASTLPPPINTEEAPPIAERRFLAEAETNPRVRIRFHTVAIGHKDDAALDVVSELLSGKTGRLYKRLVTQEEVAIGEPVAGQRGMKYAGYFEVSITVKEGKSPDEVERMTLEEIDRLRTGDIPDRELQKVKNQVLSSSVRRLQTNMGLMFQLGLFDTWLDWSYLNESPKRMLAVTADDVRRVVKKYFDPKTRTVGVYLTREKTTAPAAPEHVPARTEGASATPAPAPAAAGESAEPLTPGDVVANDPEALALWHTLSPKLQKGLRMKMEEIAMTEDPKLLEGRAAITRSALAQRPVPEDQKTVFNFLIQRMEERAAALRAAQPNTKARKE